MNYIVPDSGNIYISKNMTIGYLPQNTVLESNNTIWDELMQVFSSVIEIEKRLRQIEIEMSNYHSMNERQYQKLLDDYSALQEKFEKCNGYNYRSLIRGVLSGLGFTAEEYEQPICQLSGGQKTRIALGKILLEKPDILLLDEPTNHLDLDATQWLEGYLSEYPGTILMISHDRYFLDNLCDSILEIENGRSSFFKGNYSEYNRKKQQLNEQHQKEYELQQKEIARQQQIIQRFRSFNREKSIRAAESRQKALDRMEKIEKVYMPESIRFTFDIRKQSGQDVLFVQDVTKSFGSQPLFENISFSIHRGDRVGIIGPNGCGKSTLLKIILGDMKPSSGKIVLGTGVEIGYYDQELTSLHKENDILNEVWNDFPNLTELEIRNALAAFLFKGDDVYKIIGSLSGGEKSRVLLTKLMLSGNNFLLLDEPTNNLDMASRERLEKALLEYPGTILVVSHDRYFLNKIVDRILAMEPDGIKEYLGNYNDYLEKKKAFAAFQEPQPNLEPTKTALKEERKRQRQEQEKRRQKQKEINNLEDCISKLEEKIKLLEEQMCDPALYGDLETMLKIQQEYKETKEHLDVVYSQWMQMTEEIM
jgi:ATP-binding cassette subfamily F protein 3